MEDTNKEGTTILAILHHTLAILSSIAKSADLPAFAFLIGMAESESAQT